MINPLTDFWHNIYRRWEAGEILERGEIDFALQAPGDIPSYAKPFIAALIAGQVRLRRGPPSSALPETWNLMLSQVEALRAAIGSWRRGETREQVRIRSFLEEEEISYLASLSGKPIELAIQRVADEFGVTYEALLQKRKRERRSRR